MRSRLQRVTQNVSQHRTSGAAASLITLSAFSTLTTPNRHSLLISALSWGLVCAGQVSKVGLGLKSHNGTGKSRRLTVAAGLLYALSAVCEATSKDVEALWWTKSLLPICVFLVYYALDITPNPPPPIHTDGLLKPETNTAKGPSALLLTATISALIALSGRYALPSSTALGLCSALLQGSVLILLDMAIKSATVDYQAMAGGFVMADGSMSRRDPGAGNGDVAYKAVCRDVAAAIALTSALGAISFESFRLDNGMGVVQYWRFGWQLSDSHANWHIILIPLLALIDTVRNLLLLHLIQRRGALSSSFYIWFATIAACLLTRVTLGTGWFAILSILASILFFDEAQPQEAVITAPKHLRRVKRTLIFVSTLSFALWAASHLPHSIRPVVKDLNLQRPAVEMAPMEFASMATHPMEQLMDNAEAEFGDMLLRQSQTLDQAVAEYQRRYRMHPPPHFDRWFAFAKQHDVRLVDEFDNLHEALLPFWALDPAVIRNRTRAALGHEGNALCHVAIRDGRVVRVGGGGDDWFRDALTGMLTDIVEHLPDMDLAFNIHDEPRVIVAHEERAAMVDFARSVAIPDAFRAARPVPRFSPRPADVGDGRRVKPVTTTLFNHFAHQDTWTHSRLACAPLSPARTFHLPASDNLTAWAVTPLAFVRDTTAHSDVCLAPSLATAHGVFQRPNAFNLALELLPVFSQSKVSSFADILYPSPWYWADRRPYVPAADVPWDQKNRTLYWRGSTTGGFSRDGGWRQQHRQRVVRLLNAPAPATVLHRPPTASNTEDPSLPRNWEPTTLPHHALADQLDVHFTSIGQCDPGDCAAQSEFFPLRPAAPFGDAHGARHALDVDGNAFSGRFHALLRSRSAVVKVAVFREWHDAWLRAWVHYVPLSLRGGEGAEIVRWLGAEGAGRARGVGEAGREWAGRALRRKDMEAWLFRALLEYGRLVDDGREGIGFVG